MPQDTDDLQRQTALADLKAKLAELKATVAELDKKVAEFQSLVELEDGLEG